MANEIRYEIKEHIGVISESYSMNDGRRYNERIRELNMVSWNGREPRLDLRLWSPDHKYAGKGVTFSESESRELLKLLKKIIK